jgi:hypothetical protein
MTKQPEALIQCSNFHHSFRIARCTISHLTPESVQLEQDAINFGLEAKLRKWFQRSKYTNDNNIDYQQQKPYTVYVKRHAIFIFQESYFSII